MVDPVDLSLIPSFQAPASLVPLLVSFCSDRPGKKKRLHVFLFLDDCTLIRLVLLSHLSFEFLFFTASFLFHMALAKAFGGGLLIWG